MAQYSSGLRVDPPKHEEDTYTIYIQSGVLYNWHNDRTESALFTAFNGVLKSHGYSVQVAESRALAYFDATRG